MYGPDDDGQLYTSEDRPVRLEIVTDDDQPGLF